MTETARLAEEAKEEMHGKLESVDESALNRSDDIVTKDHYTALREEISNYYGTSILQVSEDEDNESAKIFPPSERNIMKKEGFVRKKEFIKTEKRCNDYSTKREENNRNEITWRLSAKDEDNESENMFLSSETNISINKEERYVRKNDFIKMENECADYSRKFKENNTNPITWSWSGNMLSKLISFGDMALKYVPNPWTPENSDTYLNRLSKQLTG